MKLHARTLKVQKARTQIAIKLDELQHEHDLTDLEMLGALNQYVAGMLKYMLREERHPDDPDALADEE